MGRKVLIVSSTPRPGGNSELLCEQVKAGAAEAGNSVKMRVLRDAKLQFCTGCGACTETGKCVIRDDAEGFARDFEEADVIVLASPVYFYSMCAQMKQLIDRMSPYYESIRNKEFYWIATAADDNPACCDRTFEAFRGFLDCLSDCRECGVIRGVGVWKKGEIRSKPAMKEAFELGKNL